MSIFPSGFVRKVISYSTPLATGMRCTKYELHHARRNLFFFPSAAVSVRIAVGNARLPHQLL